MYFYILRYHEVIQQVRDFGKTKEEVRIGRVERDQMSKERNAAAEAAAVASPVEEKEEKRKEMVMPLLFAFLLISPILRSKTVKGISLTEGKQE